MDSLPVSDPLSFPVVPWGDGDATFTTNLGNGDEAPWAVVVFVVDGDRFLLGMVPRGWCTPSGHVEPDESPDDAARREVYEETGACVDRIEVIGRFVTRTRPDVVAHALVYVATVQERGAIPNGSESADARWFEIAEVASVYWHWDDLMQRMFEYALRCARSMVSPHEHEPQP